jgi:uncharacterized membrane protein
MATHYAEVTVEAPAAQVWQMFSHLNDFPRYMSHVREVTYKDEERSHWVVDIYGRHEWDAINEGWIPGRQIGWRSLDGLENSGRVTFHPAEGSKTIVTVAIEYRPPAGLLGDIAERLVTGVAFERTLREELDHFARMVEAAPRGALNPAFSDYLYHDESATSQRKSTDAQDATADVQELARRWPE